MNRINTFPKIAEPVIKINTYEIIITGCNIKTLKQYNPPVVYLFMLVMIKTCLKKEEETEKEINHFKIHALKDMFSLSYKMVFIF